MSFFVIPNFRENKCVAKVLQRFVKETFEDKKMVLQIMLVFFVTSFFVCLKPNSYIHLKINKLEKK